MITLDNAKTAIDVVARTVNEVRKVTGHVTTSALTDVTKLTRVEPTAIVSPDCMSLDYAPAIQQSLLSLFCAQYMMALDILGNVNSVEVVRILDKLNPNRDSTGWLLSQSDGIRRENNLAYTLPLPGQKMRLENTDRNGPRSSTPAESKITIQDNVNLSVGRLLDVTLTTKNNLEQEVKTSLKVQVRLMTSSIANEGIIGLLSGQGSRGVVESWHGWRSGRLEFVRDIILCQDMIDEKMRNAVNDSSGKGLEIYQRVATNRKFGVLTNNPSLNTASNMYVISKDVASQIEYRVGGKMSSFSTRQKVFEGSYAMVIVVVDIEKARCNFYVRGQPDYATVSRKDMEAAVKGGKGPDVMEIFRSLSTSSFSNF